MVLMHSRIVAACLCSSLTAGNTPVLLRRGRLLARSSQPTGTTHCPEAAVRSMVAQTTELVSVEIFYSGRIDWTRVKLERSNLHI